ncbi:MAG: hypothetical protein HFG33_04890 [Bacilli bacterium]|nr:hypothetical protein [Bacilli bacterium]
MKDKLYGYSKIFKIKNYKKTNYRVFLDNDSNMGAIIQEEFDEKKKELLNL